MVQVVFVDEQIIIVRIMFAGQQEGLGTRLHVAIYIDVNSHCTGR